MPKERIESSVGPYEVKVGWNQHGGLQVGVEGNDERSVFWLLFGHEQAKARLTEALKASVPRDADDLLNLLDSVGPYHGIWADLDRHGSNQLIRVLRRARDAAFGRDE